MRERLQGADRGVSTSVNYALSLLIVTLLMSALFSGAAGLLQGEQKQAVATELRVVGNRLATDLVAADQLASATGTTGAVRLTSDLPSNVAGTSYRITVADAGGGWYDLTLTTDSPTVEVTVTVKTDTPVTAGTVNGRSVVVSYSTATATLEVENE